MNDCYNSQLLCHISSVTYISGTKRQAYHRSPTEYWWIISGGWVVGECKGGKSRKKIKKNQKRNAFFSRLRERVLFVSTIGV